MSTNTDDLTTLDAQVDELASSSDPALAQLLADDFIYVHTSGLRQDKQTWLDSLVPLVGRRQRVVSNVLVDLHGDVAVAMGDLDIVWTDRPTVKNRYVRVYRLDGGGTWRVIAQRTVPAPDRS